jgi:Uncharacterized conserved protein (DUF2358)
LCHGEWIVYNDTSHILLAAASAIMRNPAKSPAFCFLVFLAGLDHSTIAFLMMAERPNSMRRLHLTSSNNDKSPPHRRPSSGDPVSQGIVSALTAVVNTLSNTKQQKNNSDALPLLVPAVSTNNHGTTTTAPPPLNGNELLRRIERDYTERNYLWTGDIDYACYDVNCCFSDPTLTFHGTNTYARNIGNLRPIVDRFVRNGRSELLSIRLGNNDDDPSSTPYIETRWNMVGDLPQLPWRPRIDVIGNTKFWFHHHQKNDTTTTTTTTTEQQQQQYQSSCQVYLYDEQWEIPPWRALLQLLTKAGTIPNSIGSTN